MFVAKVLILIRKLCPQTLEIHHSHRYSLDFSVLIGPRGIRTVILEYIKLQALPSLSFFIVVQVKWSPISCHHFPPLHPPPPPTFNPTPLWVCPCVLYTCSLKPFSFFHPLSFPLPSGYCQFVLYFNVSGYVLLACFFCWLASTYSLHFTFKISHRS